MAGMASGGIAQPTHYRTCSLCEAMCGIVVESDGGAIRAIRGDADDPFSRGHICPKAVALADLHTDPDRLRRPLRRDGDGWKEIGWDEALDEAASRLVEVQKRHGRDSIAVYLGNPNVHNYGALLLRPRCCIAPCAAAAATRPPPSTSSPTCSRR